VLCSRRSADSFLQRCAFCRYCATEVETMHVSRQCVPPSNTWLKQSGIMRYKVKFLTVSGLSSARWEHFFGKVSSYHTCCKHCRCTQISSDSRWTRRVCQRMLCHICQERHVCWAFGLKFAQNGLPLWDLVLPAETLGRVTRFCALPTLPLFTDFGPKLIEQIYSGWIWSGFRTLFLIRQVARTCSKLPS